MPLSQKDLNHLVALGLLRPVEIRSRTGRDGYKMIVVYRLTKEGRDLTRETNATYLRRRLRENREHRTGLEREMERARKLGMRINLLKSRL
jgi:hypothetical protein